jgi:hypothetical protein
VRALKPLVVGAVVGTMLAWSYPAGAGEQCYWINMEGITEETVKVTAAALQEQGWYSDPTDGLEALYSPSCLSQEGVEQS